MTVNHLVVVILLRPSGTSSILEEEFSLGSAF